MIDKLPLEKISKRIFVVLFLLINCLILAADADALVYCVGCADATGATCTGGGANCATGAGFCDGGTNSVVCGNIVQALTCIDDNDDPFATIRIAQGSHTGPGTGDTIDNTASGSNQTINILGGFDATDCTSRTLNPSNTIINAPFEDRGFKIDNTISDSLEVKLEGLTITGGDPEPGSNLCANDDDGGGVCATSTANSGGLVFISNSNIYVDNTAESGGGLAVIADDPGGGNIDATIMDDEFTDNFADFAGGGILLFADDHMLDATIDNTTIGGDVAFPFGGNRAVDEGGGIAILADDGEIDVSNQGNSITNNSTTAMAGPGGGGIIIRNGSSITPITVSLEEDVITSNVSADKGGGIAIEDDSAIVNVLISKTEIGSNTAEDFGGGISLTGDGDINLFPVVNNVIFQNTALGQPGGGGVAAVTSANSSDYDIRFVNNTIADNVASDTGAIGGGILADSTGGTGLGDINWTLPNDLISGNTADGDGDEVALANTGDDATLALRFTLVPQSQPGDILGATGAPPLAGFVNILENVISGDPEFINAPAGNYRILNTSPANGEGTNMADPTTIAGPEADPPSDDFDGTARPVPPAIGAFQPGPAPTPTVSPTPTPSPTPTVAPTATATATAFPTLTPPPITPTLPPTTTPTIIPTPPNIVTIPNARNGKLVTLISPLGTTLTDVDAFRTLQGCADGFNGQFLNFPIGSFEYVVSRVERGGSTTVEIILPPGTTINSFFKFGPEPDNPEPHCYEFLFDEFTGTGAEIFNDRVVVHFIDGERGDCDLVPNGIVCDPGGPALLSDEPIDGGGGCALSQTVQSGSAILNLFIPILPALAFGLRILRRKNVKG